MADYNENLTPPQIKSRLDQDIIGQDEIKKTLAILSYYFIQAQRAGTTDGTNNNALIIGDTGVGKTALIKSLARILKLPYAVGDASSLTTAGFKGNNIDSIFEPFLKYCGRYPGNKIPGIIFIDEVDKMITKTGSSSTTNLQNEFLKIIEGGEVHLETSPYKGTGRITINTSAMMFIFAGSFPNLRKIIKARLKKSSAEIEIDAQKIIKDVKHEDLENFGLSREFLGRISTIRAMEPMSAEMLKSIFTQPANSVLNQYRAKVKGLGVELNFTSEAIDYVVAQALETNTGARGLMGITQEIMDNVLYKIPEEKNARQIRVTLAAAQNKDPEIIYAIPEPAPSVAKLPKSAPAQASSSPEGPNSLLVQAQVIIQNMLLYTAQAEEYFEKVNECKRADCEIKNSFWRGLFQTDSQIETAVSKLFDNTEYLRENMAKLNRYAGELTTVNKKLAAQGYQLPGVSADKHLYKISRRSHIELPNFPVLLERALTYKNTLDIIISREISEILDRAPSAVPNIMPPPKNSIGKSTPWVKNELELN